MGPSVIAVGPMLGPTLEASWDVDATVLYATSILPFDAETIRREGGEQMIVVEPFLQGTVAPRVAEALRDRSIRLASIGVPRTNLRGYGSPSDLDRVAEVDVPGIRRQLLAAISPARSPPQHPTWTEEPVIRASCRP